MNDFEKSQAAKIASFYSNTEELQITKAEDALNSELQKGGKAAVLGEKRMFGDREYIKTASGWKFHGKGTGAKAQGHAAAHSEKTSSFSEHSDQELQQLINNLSSDKESIQKDPQKLEAAKKELSKRAEKVKGKVSTDDSHNTSTSEKKETAKEVSPINEMLSFLKKPEYNTFGKSPSNSEREVLNKKMTDFVRSSGEKGIIPRDSQLQVIADASRFVPNGKVTVKSLKEAIKTSILAHEQESRDAQKKESDKAPNKDLSIDQMKLAIYKDYKKEVLLSKEQKDYYNREIAVHNDGSDADDYGEPKEKKGSDQKHKDIVGVNSAESLHQLSNEQLKGVSIKGTLGGKSGKFVNLHHNIHQSGNPIIATFRYDEKTPSGMSSSSSAHELDGRQKDYIKPDFKTIDKK